MNRSNREENIAKIDHGWYLDSGVHEVPVWNNNLYLFAQMLFKPKGSVTPPSSIGEYDGSSAGGMMGGRGMTGTGGGNVNAEYTAKRVNGDAPSKGAAGTWVAKDGDNEIKLDLKVDGSKLTGTIENTQCPEQSRLKMEK